MTHCVFAGCSYTAGSGFEQERQDPRLWTMQLHQSHSALNRTHYVNVGNGGASNARIFYEAVQALLKFDCEFAFVAWTSVPRYEMDLGLELYQTRQCFIPNTASRDHDLNLGTISAEYLNKVRDRFVSLAHDHREIWFLLGYINQLMRLSLLRKTKLFFVNALCPWDTDFFIKRENSFLPNDLTKYTQTLLNVNTRSDQEIFKLYDFMHQEYEQQGGVHEQKWLNLYQSIRSLKIDSNSDGRHPGPKTNQLATELFLCQLDQKL